MPKFRTCQKCGGNIDAWDRHECEDAVPARIVRCGERDDRQDAPVELIADRDRWKARAQAMERTIMQLRECWGCERFNGCADEVKRECVMTNGGRFKFDKTRFMYNESELL